MSHRVPRALHILTILRTILRGGSFLCQSSSEDVFINFRERKEEGERSIDRLPPVRAPTRDRTRNLLVYRRALQLSCHWPGQIPFLILTLWQRKLRHRAKGSRSPKVTQLQIQTARLQNPRFSSPQVTSRLCRVSPFTSLLSLLAPETQCALAQVSFPTSVLEDPLLPFPGAPSLSPLRVTLFSSAL